LCGGVDYKLDCFFYSLYAANKSGVCLIDENSSTTSYETTELVFLLKIEESA